MSVKRKPAEFTSSEERLSCCSCCGRFVTGFPTSEDMWRFLVTHVCLCCEGKSAGIHDPLVSFDTVMGFRSVSDLNDSMWS